MKRIPRFILRILPIVLLPLLAVLSGCAAFQNYPEQAAQFQSLMQQENFVAAAKFSASAAHRPGSAILWHLEEGTAWRHASRIPESLQAFSKAEGGITDFDQRPVLSLRDAGATGLSALTNQQALPYRGWDCDRILLNTYKALDYLALGKMDDTCVELRRAYLRQQEAVEHHKKELERTQKDSAKSQVNLDELMKDKALSAYLRDLDSQLAGLPKYAEYVNPFTVYLDALVHLARGADGNDFERARRGFARVAAMIGANAFLPQDLAEVKRVESGKTPTPTVWVLLENGAAPVLTERRLDLPIPSKQGLLHVGIALPELHIRPRSAGRLMLRAGGRRIQAVSLADMNAIMGRELKNRMPRIILRAVISATTRAVAQYQLSRKLGDGGQLTGMLFSFLANNADLRTWHSLPGEFQLLRLPRPAGNEVFLSFPGISSSRVNIPNGVYVLVYARLYAGTLTITDTLTLR